MYCSHFGLVAAVTRRDRSESSRASVKGLRSVRGRAWHPHNHKPAARGCCRLCWCQLTAASDERSLQDGSTTQSTTVIISSPYLIMASRWVIGGGLGSSWTPQTSQTPPTWRLGRPAPLTWTRPSTGRWPRSVDTLCVFVTNSFPLGRRDRYLIMCVS